MHTFFNAIFWRLFPYKTYIKEPAAIRKKKTRTAPNRPRPSYHSYSFYVIPRSVSNILTVQIHRNLLHTFFIKLRYFTIICTTFILYSYLCQTTCKSHKIKHLSHFQAIRSFSEKHKPTNSINSCLYASIFLKPPVFSLSYEPCLIQPILPL